MLAISLSFSKLRAGKLDLRWPVGCLQHGGNLPHLHVTSACGEQQHASSSHSLPPAVTNEEHQAPRNHSHLHVLKFLTLQMLKNIFQRQHHL